MPVEQSTTNKQPVINKPIIPLRYTPTFNFIKSLENPYNEKIENGKALLYDAHTAGYGTDIRSHPDLVERIINGQWTELEARDQAVKDMRYQDKILMRNMKRFTQQPDTISEGPRLLIAQARYHHGNLLKNFPEWGKAIAEGNAKKQKEIALELAEGYPERYKTIEKFNIYK